MEIPLKNKLKAYIKKSRKPFFLRSDFRNFGDYRQVSRALASVEREGLIDRPGYGIYKKKSALVVDVDKSLALLKRRLGARVCRTIQLGERVIKIGNTPVRKNQQSQLDEFKLALAKVIVDRFDLNEVRQKSLLNLERWKHRDVWCSAYDEWSLLLQVGSDQKLIGTMTGEDENSNRLRQSPPYVGLLSQEALERLRETKRS